MVLGIGALLNLAGRRIQVAPYKRAGPIGSQRLDLTAATDHLLSSPNWRFGPPQSGSNYPPNIESRDFIPFSKTMQVLTYLDDAP